MWRGRGPEQIFNFKLQVEVCSHTCKFQGHFRDIFMRNTVKNGQRMLSRLQASKMCKFQGSFLESSPSRLPSCDR